VKITTLQHEVLIGGLLGDASLELSGRMRSPRLKIERSYKDIQYLQWQFSVFRNLCHSGLHTYKRYDKRYDKVYKSSYLRTRQLPELLSYYKKWYPNNKRDVPRDIKLTPLTLAVWVADDGCIIKEKNSYIIKLSTESFTPEGVDYLRFLLRDYTGQHFPKYKKHKDKNQFFIKATSGPAISVLKIIRDQMKTMNMGRKIPPDMPERVFSSKNYYELFKYIKDNPWCNCDDLVGIYNEKGGLRSRLNAATKHGFLYKKNDDVDGRLKRYSLTETGKEALKSDGIVNLHLFSKG